MKNILIYSFIIWSSNFGFSQELQYSFTDLIQHIEQSTDFIFNYDINETDKYSIDKINSDNITIEKLQSIFHKSPFDMTFTNNLIVISPPEIKSFSVCGTMMSESEQSPLAYASILSESGFGIQTDENGFFELQINSLKNELVYLNYLGYSEKSFMVQDLLKCKPINLSVNTNLFNEEIVIKGYVENGIKPGEEFGALHINNKQIDHSILGSDSDILRSIQQLPGISSPDDSATNLTIRGSSFDQNLIIWEGVTLYNTGHLFGMISSINPFLINKTIIHKGVFGPDYANRVGGVIDLKLDHAVPSSIEAGVGIDLTQLHSYLKLPLSDKIGMYIGGRTSAYTIFENTPTLNSFSNKVFEYTRVTPEGDSESEENESELSIEFYDINAKIIAEVSPKTTVELSQFYSENDFEFQSAFNNLGISTLDISDSHTLGLSNTLSHQWDRNQQSDIQALYSNYGQNYSYQLRNENANSDRTAKEIHNDIKEFQLSLNHRVNTKNHTFNGGYQYDRKQVGLDVNQVSSITEDFENIEDVSATFHHLFADFAWHKYKTTFQIGNRLTYRPDLESIRLGPRIHLKHKLFKQLSINLSAGIFHQDVRQLYALEDNDLSLVKQIWTISDDKEDEHLSAYKFSAGAVFSNERWLVDLESFYHYTTGISARNPAIRNQFVVDDMGMTHAIGMDLLINHRWPKHSASLSYTLSSNRVGFPGLLEENESERFPANNDQSQILQYTHHWKFNNIQLNSRFHYKTGLPFSDPSNISEYEDEDEDELEYDIEYDEFNDSRLPAYLRFDIGFQYKKSIGPIQTELGFTVQNLLGRENVSSRHDFISDPTSNEAEIIQLERRLLGRTLTAFFRVRL